MGIRRLPFAQSQDEEMKPELIEILACPLCYAKFETKITEESSGDIRSGFLICREGHRFPITRSVPRFVDADKYADSFSVQRRLVRRQFNNFRKDRSGDERFFASTGLSTENVTKGLSLEVGCGYGRYLDVVSRLGGTIVGVDLSTHSIDLAQEFVGDRPNVHLVQCDLFALPFPRQRFDNVFSLGVLHHTPNTRQAFEAIVPLARTGGRVSIWVYHPRNKVHADRWRVVTTRLPYRALYGWCVLNQALFSWIRALPGGGRFNAVIPGSRPRKGRPFWLRVLSDFDSLSPRFAFSHTEEEVRQWFVEAGLSDIQVLDFPTAVTGVQPQEREIVQKAMNIEQDMPTKVSYS